MSLFDPILGVKKPDILALYQRKAIKSLIHALDYGDRKYKLYKAGKNNFDLERLEVEQVVVGAAAALAELGASAAILPIIRVLVERPYEIGNWDHTDDPSSPPSVILGRFGPSAIDPLIDLLKYGQSRVHGWATTALGHIGDAHAVPTLLSNYTPHATVWALGNIGGGKEVIDFLIQFLTGKDEWSESQLLPHVFGSGKFGKEAADAISDSLPSLSDHKLSYAVISLCELGDPRGMEIVLKAWNTSEYPALRYHEKTLWVIGRFDNPEVRLLLDGCLSKYNNSLRNAKLSDYKNPIDGKVFYAALGLARLGDEKSIEPLVDTLSNAELERVWPMKYESYHSAASKSILSLGDKAVERLSTLAGSPNRQISSTASGLLIDLEKSAGLIRTGFFRYS